MLYFLNYLSLPQHLHKGISNAVWNMSNFSPNEAQYLPLPQRHPP